MGGCGNGYEGRGANDGKGTYQAIYHLIEHGMVVPIEALRKTKAAKKRSAERMEMR